MDKGHEACNHLILVMLKGGTYHLASLTHHFQKFEWHHDLRMYLKELVRLGFAEPNGDEFMPTQTGIRRIQSAPIEFKDDPYGYLLSLEKIAAEKEEIKHELTVLQRDSLVDIISDYPTTQSRAKASLIISAITVGILLLMTTRELMCNKPGLPVFLIFGVLSYNGS